MSDYYDMDGKPIDMMTWAHMFQNHRDRIVQHTDIDDVRVSTVWLGLNHRFGPGHPLIYESMIFGGDHDGEQRRYTNRVAAQAGHDQMVALVRDEVKAR